MNRKERRAQDKRGLASPQGAAADNGDRPLPITDLMAQASRFHAQHQPETAREVCDRILRRDAAHVGALNLLGLILQDVGEHRLAVKKFKRALAADDLDAACHYNLASSYQALSREADAETHFKNAIALGLSQRNIDDFVFLNPAVAACLQRLHDRLLPPVRPDQMLGPADLEAIAKDMFLHCALTTILLATLHIETFLTFLRSALLSIVYSAALPAAGTDHNLVRLFCALAQQCFINEYVFAQSEIETRQAREMRDLLLQRLTDGEEIPPFLLAAVAAYFPLHALPDSRALAARAWPEAAAALVRQQVFEPQEEAGDIPGIPVLTAIDNGVSRQVMEQYAENPYPRWTIDPILSLAANWKWPTAFAGQGIDEVLIAGCGTGQHVFHVKHNFPKARVLALDISLPSLAFARRKAREAKLADIEFAQADILALDGLGRTFDLIEAVGVLHHLAEPERGWQVLLSMLRPNGEMRIGLYSKAARRDLATVRAFISQRGYRATPDDIRRFRQDILHDTDQRRRNAALRPRDFYSTSGCRDLLFHVMEDSFTIPRVKAFLENHGLLFLGFDLESEVTAGFQERFPGESALLDLDLWNVFEAENPETFRLMYQFMVRKK